MFDTLTEVDLTASRALRHTLHRAPELSGQEGTTAGLIAARMRALGAEVVTGLGGTGVAAIFGDGADGLMIRCELDALPIDETGTPDWQSQVPGVAHLCGHDGHMAILDAVAQRLAQATPRTRVILLFQPAEETGAGAAAVLADPRFAALGARMAISLHNMPGLPLGAVGLRAGPMNCASRGLKITLTGRTAHASAPETGLSPGTALAALIPALSRLSRDVPTEDPAFRLATVTHARLGEPTFGVSPGTAELRVTLRSLLDDQMAALEAEARALIVDAAGPLSVDITVHEAFGHCVNHPEAVALLEQSVAGMARTEQGLPMRASEDFGRYGAVLPSAMFLLGSGESCPPLHAPDYDFPDQLIAVGAQIFLRAVDQWARDLRPQA
ncbi:amidohydrolase [Sagittula marina]|uniref:Amidohydrolase n=1 Tax=Sagittula marina TaxID=943940 RepID=A0A7W6DQN8_9RHOB|nr:amidohydrolase [Sagittula marina]MBB3987039.1 amidohydrolase [Sagittula marina]